MDIKNMLISIRESKGYSKRTVSEMTGIPYTTYIKYESGERKDVSMQALCKLADFYGVSADYLLGRKPAVNPFEVLDKMSGKKDTLDTLKMYMQLPENVQQAIIDFMVQVMEACKSEEPKKQRYVERLGDIEDEQEQERQAKDGTSCA